MLTIAACADTIKAGGLVAFPTETVYGLGADAASDSAVAKIFAAKGRPADHPLIVHVADAAAVAVFARAVPDFAARLMHAFWPGPLTVILPRKEGVATACAGGQGSIGLRCPAHPMALELLAACAQRGVHGVAAPSANQFGRVSPTSAAHVRSEFAGAQAEPIAVLDGGACSVGIESTIIDCTRGAPVLLRPGVLTRAQLETAMGQKLLSNEELSAHILQGEDAKNGLKNGQNPVSGMPESAPRASGTLDAHYAPVARLRMMDENALQTALDVLGHEAAHIAVYSRAVLRSPSEKLIRRRMPDDAVAAAQQLFAALRDFDAQGVRLIWVQTPPAHSDWDGVRDRLQRAAAAD